MLCKVFFHRISMHVRLGGLVMNSWPSGSIILSCICFLCPGCVHVFLCLEWRRGVSIVFAHECELIFLPVNLPMPPVFFHVAPMLVPLCTALMLYLCCMFLFNIHALYCLYLLLLFLSLCIFVGLHGNLTYSFIPGSKDSNILNCDFLKDFHYICTHQEMLYHRNS